MLNGHAYAEVLFDEIGWLTFEPTSSTSCPTCDANGGTTTGDDDSVVGNGTQPGTDYVMSDTDGDGFGDNLNGNNGDVFPNDSSEWKDSDEDGVGNNADQYPYAPTQTVDSDGDG